MESVTNFKVDYNYIGLSEDRCVTSWELATSATPLSHLSLIWTRSTHSQDKFFPNTRGAQNDWNQDSLENDRE